MVMTNWAPCSGRHGGGKVVEVMDKVDKVDKVDTVDLVDVASSRSVGPLCPRFVSYLHFATF